MCFNIVSQDMILILFFKTQKNKTAFLVFKMCLRRLKLPGLD